MLYYNNDFLDFCMHHNKSLSRYRGLARKAIAYYLGDLYNPETLNAEVELLFRQSIRNYIKLKVFDGIPYDWPVIDHFFRKVLHDEGFTHITYDMSILEKGYQGVMRGELPKFGA